MAVQENSDAIVTSTLRKYLLGKCSWEEAKKVIELIENPVHDEKILELLEAEWELRFSEPVDQEALTDQPMMDRMLDRLHHQISLAEEEKSNHHKLFRLAVSFFSKAAAVLIVPLLVYSIYVTGTRSKNTPTTAFNSSIVWQTTKTPAGMQTEFTLPDGSHVWLNSGSVIRYPTAFAADVRQVELTGEAFFDVAKIEKQPFIVKAGKMNIEVKGTRFDVINYPNDAMTELILESGSVRLFSENNNNRSTIANIRPGQSAVIDNAANKLTIQKVDVEKFTAWKEGKLIFRDDRMDEVVRKLNRWFNVDIVLKSPELNDYVYTATYRDETLTQILELLTISAPIKYSVSERERQSDNSYSKRKIVLTRRKK